MKGAFLEGSEVRTVSDRGRRAAFWVSFAFFAQINFIFILFAMNHPMEPWHWGLYAFYAFALGSIAWSAYKNWHLSIVLGVSFGLMFVEIWLRSYLLALYPLHSSTTVHVPTLLFIPVFLMLVSGFRTLLLYALVQAPLVYFYVKYHLAGVYGFDAEPAEMAEPAFVLALISFIALIVLSIMAFSRQKTDKRLLALIRETERLAAEDPLTGLKNRRAFMEALETIWTKKTPFSVVFIDLDRFKPLNDEYGHAIGDRVLQAVGSRLKEATCVVVAARLGGDEFAAIIADQDSEDSLDAIIKELHQKISAEIDIDIAKVSVGSSFGYARALDDGFTISELLHAADTAMMRCKSDGGGIAKFDPEKDDVRLSASAMVEVFKKALASGNIKPALQPIVDANTHQIVGHELLARWQDSGLAREPTPADFIPIAEQLGLLNELLWWTLRGAMPYLRDRGGFLAINVSPSQLSSSTFLKDLEALAKDCDFSMHRIELEITELVAFRNLEENKRVLQQAQALGCQIVLDDFGSGYSSLSLLDDLPLDKIKLDKALQGSDNKKGVLQAAIKLAKGLDFVCCVEGIESADAAAFAAKHGCNQMQGFWFGRPEIVATQTFPLQLVS